MNANENTYGDIPTVSNSIDIAYGDDFADPLIKKTLDNALSGIVHATPIKMHTQVITDDAQSMTAAGDYNEDIKPEKNVMTQAREDIKPGEVLIETLNCGVKIMPESIVLEDNFVAFVLKKKTNDSFIFHPGSRFSLYLKDMQEEDISYNVYYSGIKFEYEKLKDVFFLVFHIYEE